MIELKGKRFGRLVAIKPVGRTKCRDIIWECVCDCGKMKNIDGASLRLGRTKSCGCLNREISSKCNKKHGKSRTRIFNIWQHMISRCENKKNGNYDYYGGRGIKICPKWRKDFRAFDRWSLKNGYKEGLTIDRIDNNKGYSPKNCRWVTMQQQANNKRTNRILCMKGEKHTLKEWSIIKKINYSTLQKRLKMGWDIQKTLETKIKKENTK